MNDERALNTAAEQQGYSVASTQAALVGLRQQLGHTIFYVYRSSGKSSGEGGTGETPSGKPRTILAFPSADAA
ncbi:MAG: hypothetical protein H7Y32_00820, partial [Chloroflexales bacterium]|nr:hypothetical protein [Chloroflexales bacterium]